MADFGYDVADYRDVDPVFGTLADLDELVAETPRARHQADPGLGPEPQLRPAPVVPGVPQLSRDNPKRDWYVWRDEPNDWVSVFKAVRPGVDVRRDHAAVLPAQLHARAARPELGQPRGRAGDARRAAVLDGSRRRRPAAGRDPARSPRTRCSATTPARRGRHDEDWESIHDRLRGIRKVVDEYEDRMIVGEVALQDLHRVVAYLRLRRPAPPRAQLRLHRPGLGRGGLRDRRSRTSRRLAEDHAWPAWFLANHDKPPPAQPLRPRRAGRRSARARSS